MTKNGDVASLDTDAYPCGAYPDGAYPNGAYPDGAYPNGAYPNGAEMSTSGDVDKPCEGEVDLGEVDLNDVEAEAEACMICVRVRCCILTTGSSETILV